MSAEILQPKEIQITASGRLPNYLRYATKLLVKDGLSTIIIKGAGKAIIMVLMVVESLKFNIEGLYQISKIGSIKIENPDNEYERYVSSLEVTLSKNKLDENDPGFQSPVPPESKTKIIFKTKRTQQNTTKNQIQGQ
ncbi:DNA/RNA-binding protein Alba 1 (ALBA1) [Babesia microti strain RI]|uniref:DNA/RNA-binding protein Alba 1 (ALBA1) n=1 Tax=Babesia microti (strain RI) TaxID=1133968 RepID=A0A1R4AB85_BABMR|nr:DNA/RNA-binding protein Alba 1 (ALBA1) [Babesia microti strain RI]SJK86230.1 DNA/RNA-binding protein Alba 1 (ALBA1) [Babesia microti strain RI]|eukprot:XP_021338413.1 DNA/RNA-binding protein Alba 1 (ALBA1) [Babesia microti strain RI]